MIPRGVLAVLVLGSIPAGASAPTAATGAAAAVVLHELHTITGSPVTDTLVTYVTSGRVRVSHAGGDAILDVPADRLVLLDRAERTWRSVPLGLWEHRIAAAFDESAAAADSLAPLDTAATPLHYERSGDGGRIAGFACDIYHLFTRREFFPGEGESVEQEIWVTRELELPAGAFDTYRRVLDGLDRIGLNAPLERPVGVVLRTRTRTRPEAASPEEPVDEVETSEVFRVEPQAIDPTWFAIPTGYAPADSATTGH